MADGTDWPHTDLLNSHELTGELNPCVCSAIYLDLVIKYVSQVKLTSDVKGIQLFQFSTGFIS